MSSASTQERIRSLLLALKLKTIAFHLDAQLDAALADNIPAPVFLENLLELEFNELTQRRIERRIRASRLPERKTLDDFDFDFQTGIDRRQIMTLASLDFVNRGQSLVLGGHSGTGKSHIAKALLLIGCRQNLRCRYTTAADMLIDLRSGLVDDTLGEKLKRYLAPELLCIDELGFDRLEQDETRLAALFFKVIDGRYGQKSTVLTMNMDFKALGAYLGDPVITAALVDRLVHHATIIRIEGPSWRMHQSKILNQSPADTSQLKDTKE